MPTNRRYRTRQKKSQFYELTQDIRRSLLHGRAFFEQPTIEVLRQAWEQHRDAIRFEWAENHEPDTRCFAEWLFELVPEYGERRPTARWLANGDQHRASWTKFGILHLHTQPPSQESEGDYLRRNGLL